MASADDPLPQVSTETPWWETFFDEFYGLNILERSSPEKTEGQVDFIIRELNLQPGDLCFDQCCGTGRMSLPLAARGCRVIGVDCIESYITRASQQAKKSQLDCVFVCDDARTFVTDEPCDVALNWFTSFGYSDSDTSNLDMLKRAYESLRPGGGFALDYVNMGYVLNNFKERSVHIIDPEKADSLVVLEESEPDFSNGIMHGHWTFFCPDGRRERRSMQVKMYLPHELQSMIEQCGFEQVRLFGNVTSAPLSLETPRCILVGQKPHAS